LEALTGTTSWAFDVKYGLYADHVRGENLNLKWTGNLIYISFKQQITGYFLILTFDTVSEQFLDFVEVD